MAETEQDKSGTVNGSVTSPLGLNPVYIGNIKIELPLLLAPMAGVSDFPSREIARRNGAGLCISEMVTSKTDLWTSTKSASRLPNKDDPEPRPIQIAGADPKDMAEAAKKCVDLGAGIIDINMGCPAKKVCAKAAGSALLADETLVAEILESVVNAVNVPVTLKTRTGTNPETKNAVRIAQLAESAGIQAITLHGRTRACRFRGIAEYQTIAEVASAVNIPVFANGDICSPEQARQVLKETNAAGLMIGRGAWGKPWLFSQIKSYMETGCYSEPSIAEQYQIMVEHLDLIYDFWGLEQGTRLARKHVDRYLEPVDPNKKFRKTFNQLSSASQQCAALSKYFHQLQEGLKAA